MEEKIFTKVDGRAYAEAGIACGELTPVVAVKFARVAARRGEVGEEVISYSQNGIVEKIDTVKADPETGERRKDRTSEQYYHSITVSGLQTGWGPETD